MTVADLMEQMEQIAPLALAEQWDNVGLIVGDPAAACRTVLLCIDLTPNVLAEAARTGCEAVLAYHPPVFEGLKRFTAGGIAFEAARRGIAVYSPHTALDAAAGGTNDALCEAIGLTDIRPLRPTERTAKHCKLVTFVPPARADAVADAMFAAGAGRIGRYGKCSFRSEGVGTFQGNADTNPAVGQPGVFERTPEVRIETVVTLDRVSAVVAALRSAHPYEEPAFDLFPVKLAADVAIGVGRVGVLNRGASQSDLIVQLKCALGLPTVLLADRAGGKGPANPLRVAVCAGAGRSLVPDVLASGAAVYVTGELPHHDALKLTAAGVTAVCTLHTNSERCVLPRLAARLRGFDCIVSTADRDPFVFA